MLYLHTYNNLYNTYKVLLSHTWDILHFVHACFLRVLNKELYYLLHVPSLQQLYMHMYYAKIHKYKYIYFLKIEVPCYSLFLFFYFLQFKEVADHHKQTRKYFTQWSYFNACNCVWFGQGTLEKKYFKRFTKRLTDDFQTLSTGQLRTCLNALLLYADITFTIYNLFS